VPSYSPVFSQGFIYYTTATPNTQFAVPDGYTAVVRQISMNADLADALMQVYSQNDPDAYGVLLWQGAGAGVFLTVSAEGRWVVPGGGIITAEFTSIGDSPSAYVGGYLLRNTLS